MDVATCAMPMHFFLNKKAPLQKELDLSQLHFWLQSYRIYMKMPTISTSAAWNIVYFIKFINNANQLRERRYMLSPSNIQSFDGIIHVENVIHDVTFWPITPGFA